MNRSIIVAAVILLALVGWMVSGIVKPDPEPLVAGQEARLLSVTTLASTAKSYREEVLAFGRTEPARTVTIRAETTGRVVEIGLERGEFAEEGAFLVGLDMRDRQEVLRQAQAAVDQRNMERKAAADLADKGFQATTRLAEATALLEAARADLTRAQLDIERTRITAPFSGKLDQRHVELGDFVQFGDALATILETDPIIAAAGVTEAEVVNLKAGMQGTVLIETLGRTVPATIRYVSPNSLPESRTYRIEMRLDNPGLTIPAGTTAEIRIPYGPEKFAHAVDPSLIALDTDGRVGLKVVDAESRVDFIEVRRVRTTRDGIWVTADGIPETLEVIAFGGGFAEPGQQVDAVLAQPGKGGEAR